MRELRVELGERSYPIFIGEDILEHASVLFEQQGIKKTSPLLIVTDTQVAQYHLPRVQDILAAGGYKTVTAIIESGEKSKSLSVYGDVMTVAMEAGLDRSSTVVALGGGVVGDLAGFVAATYMRGIKFVQVPTTVLAHDSSVGGKVAVNHPLSKNSIGAFHQPELVLYDIATLRTLPNREIAAGIAEIIKEGLIWDAEFVTWCDDHMEELLALDSAAMAYALHKGCSIKAHVVSLDERENDLRAILNLGHTIGHAIEAVAGYGEILHGEAISIGMIGAAKLAVELGYPERIYPVTKNVIHKAGLPIKLPSHYDTDSIMAAMMRDKKFKEGKMVFIIPIDIGKVEINKAVSADRVRAIVEQLKEEA